MEAASEFLGLKQPRTAVGGRKNALPPTKENILATLRVLGAELSAPAFCRLVAAYGAPDKALLPWRRVVASGEPGDPDKPGDPNEPDPVEPDVSLEDALVLSILRGRAQAFMVHAEASQVYAKPPPWHLHLLSSVAHEKSEDEETGPGGAGLQSASRGIERDCVRALIRCPTVSLRAALSVCEDTGVDLAEFEGWWPVGAIDAAGREGCTKELSAYLRETGLAYWPKVSRALQIEQAAQHAACLEGDGEA